MCIPGLWTLYFLAGTPEFRNLALGLSSILVFFFFFLTCSLLCSILNIGCWYLLSLWTLQVFNPRDHCVTFLSCTFLSFLFVPSLPPLLSSEFKTTEKAMWSGSLWFETIGAGAESSSFAPFLFAHFVSLEFWKKSNYRKEITRQFNVNSWFMLSGMYTMLCITCWFCS